MHYKQGQATRKKWLNVVTLNNCYFYIFKVFVKARGNVSKDIN